MEKLLLIILVGCLGDTYARVLRDYNYYGNDYYDLISREESDETTSDERVWRFMLGSDWGAYEYLDEDGYMKGFHPDLIKAVCEKAGKTCYWTIDTYQNCWNTQGEQQLPGQGLLAGWYDGCVGLYPTPERMNSFTFTKPWSPMKMSSILYRKDNRCADASNLKGRKIGLMSGWASGSGCLAHQRGLSGNQPGDYTAVFFDTVGEIVKALKEDKVDAIVLGEDFDSGANGLVQKGPILSCTVAGTSVMTRYGSPMLSWWNEAFEEMVASGEFRDLCRTSQRLYGARGTIACL